MARACWPQEDPDHAFIENRIHYWTGELARQRGLNDADREDLAQCFRLDLLLRLPGYDRAKASRRTFISLLIEHRARSLSEEHRAVKRGHDLPHLSLHDDFSPGSGSPLQVHETISEDTYLRGTRGIASSREEARDLAIDLKLMEARLTVLETTVCRLLRDMTKTEAARALGIPRTTLQGVVHQIGGKLARAGLKESCK